MLPVVTPKPSTPTSWFYELSELTMGREYIKELWRYRELLYFFAWREIKLRYRQAAFGAAWAVIQPVFGMILFTLIFGRMARMPSDGIPYPIFCYCALVPWTYFSSVLSSASTSLTTNSSLVEKVYFPRMYLPAGTALAGLLDFVVGSLLLVGLMRYYHVRASWALLFSPLVVLMMILLTTGVSMTVAALNVRYRDVKHAMPFLIQMGLFATPVIYPVTMIPERFRPFLALNPCWGIVEGFRACVFPGLPVDFKLLGTSMIVAVLVFVASVYYFRGAEKSFADVI
jgi:lipopolysaccharide transport system permease protein